MEICFTSVATTRAVLALSVAHEVDSYMKVSSSSSIVIIISRLTQYHILERVKDSINLGLVPNWSTWDPESPSLTGWNHTNLQRHLAGENFHRQYYDECTGLNYLIFTMCTT